MVIQSLLSYNKVMAQISLRTIEIDAAVVLLLIAISTIPLESICQCKALCAGATAFRLHAFVGSSSIRTGSLSVTSLVNFTATRKRCKSCNYTVDLQDSQDPNPLIRALAVRTMGCIRVDKITEYLCDPLHRTLKVSNSTTCFITGSYVSSASTAYHDYI